MTGTSQYGPSDDEALESPELDDVEAGVLDLVLLVHVDRDLAVTFDAGQRLDRDRAGLAFTWLHGDRAPCSLAHNARSRRVSRT